MVFAIKTCKISRMNANNIILIGMPGAGKSSLGVVLAKKRNMAFCDTDLLLQEGANQLLSEIIQERGLDGFRQYENYILSGLECDNTVISTGGSAVYGADAMKHFRKIGSLVFLDCSLKELNKRLGPDLLARGVTIKKSMTLQDLYEERQPLYKHWADYTLDTSDISMREAVEALDEMLA